MEQSCFVLFPRRCLGSYCRGAVWVAIAEALSAAAGLVSMLSFVLIAYVVGDYNAERRRVILVDLAASALLVEGHERFLNGH